jgi:hypothetical protein
MSALHRDRLAEHAANLTLWLHEQGVSQLETVPVLLRAMAVNIVTLERITGRSAKGGTKLACELLKEHVEALRAGWIDKRRA